MEKYHGLENYIEEVKMLPEVSMKKNLGVWYTNQKKKFSSKEREGIKCWPKQRVNDLQAWQYTVEHQMDCDNGYKAHISLIMLSLLSPLDTPDFLPNVSCSQLCIAILINVRPQGLIGLCFLLPLHIVFLK
jgi:hypothetical protein